MEQCLPEAMGYGNEEKSIKGYKCLVMRKISSEDAVHSLVAILMLLHCMYVELTETLDLKCFQQTGKHT